MLTLLADLAAAARATHRAYFTASQVKLAAQLDAAGNDSRRVGGIAVVHDHDSTAARCTPGCQLVAPQPPMANDPHR